MSRVITREQLESLLGEVDDDFVAEIVATAAHEHLVARALHDIENGEVPIEPIEAPTYLRVRRLLEGQLAQRGRDRPGYVDASTD